MSNSSENVESRILPVACTEVELKTYASEMADMELIEKDKEDVLATTTAAMKLELKGMRAGIRMRAGIIKSGQHMREVECDWKMNHPGDGIKSLVRFDTGEIVTSSNMSQEEQQQSKQLSFAKGYTIEHKKFAGQA